MRFKETWEESIFFHGIKVNKMEQNTNAINYIHMASNKDIYFVLAYSPSIFNYLDIDHMLTITLLRMQRK